MRAHHTYEGVREREAANVFSNNKLCHLSLLLQEKHFKSRNAFETRLNPESIPSVPSQLIVFVLYI